MKTDIGVTFGSLGVLGAKKVPTIARQAEEMGFNSFWTITEQMACTPAAPQA